MHFIIELIAQTRAWALS